MEETSLGKGKYLGLRIDSDTHHKLKLLSEYEGRSINGQILYLIRQSILEHEKKHRKINMLSVHNLPTALFYDKSAVASDSKPVPGLSSPFWQTLTHLFWQNAQKTCSLLRLSTLYTPFPQTLSKSYSHPILSILKEKTVMHQVIHIIHIFLMFITSFQHPFFPTEIFVYMS